MEPLDVKMVREYVEENIGVFHQRRANSIKQLELKKLLSKNPYLFRAKNVLTASEMIEGLLEAFLSSSEEQLFGSFLESLAVFVAQCTSGGHKSAAEGVDLEFVNRGIHYVISIKSGPNWGNNSQQNQLQTNLQQAVTRLKQQQAGANVQPVLGICYGKTRTSYVRGYLKVVGQNFWYLISENKKLYTEIVEPIGYRAKEYNDDFSKQKPQLVNRLNREFLAEFCDSSGAIDWSRLVHYTCGNYDLGKFLADQSPCTL
jgi:hypothetical protein